MTLDDFELLNAAQPPEVLAAFERSIGSALPEGYRRFLSQCDGGKARPKVLDTPDGRSLGVGVTRFLGLDDDEDSIRGRLNEYVGRIDAHLLPIADAEGGNLVLLSISGPDVGSAWFWDHEMEADEGEPPRPEAMTRLARDFQELLAALRVEDGEPAAGRSPAASAWIDPAFLAQLREGEGGPASH